MSTTIDGGSIPQPGANPPPSGPSDSSSQTSNLMNFLNQLSQGFGLTQGAPVNTTQITQITGSSTISEVPTLDTSVSVGNTSANVTSSPKLKDAETKNDPLSNPHIGQALSANPWLQKTALADIVNAMFDILLTQQKGKFEESMKAIKNNNSLWESTGDKARLLNEEGKLILAKAIAQFATSVASAGISVALAVQTAGSSKSAEKTIAKEMETLKSNPKTDTLTSKTKEGQELKGVDAWVQETKNLKEMKETRDLGKPSGVIDQKTGEEIRAPLNEKEKATLNKQIEDKQQLLKETQPGFAQIEASRKDSVVVQSKNQNQPPQKEDLPPQLQELKNTSEKRYNNFCPNGYLDTNNPKVQARINSEMQINATKYNSMNEVNSKISQGINQILEGAFGMMQKDMDANMAYIDQWMNSFRMNMDAAKESKNSIAQDFNNIINSLDSTIRAWWQGVGNMGRG